jgi:hypothetical protein
MLEPSTNLPLVRITPPSEPTKNWFGLRARDDRVLVRMHRLALRVARHAT